MASIRDYMILVERLFLVEHNVINPQAIDGFVQKFIARTKPEVGKAWFQKKLRSFIINDDQYLKKVDADTLAHMSDVPDYIKAAADRGDALYDFDPTNRALAKNIDALDKRMIRVSDWFNALDKVANQTATNPVEVESKQIATKWLEKLNKIPLVEIGEIANNWFSQMGSRIEKPIEKKGVKVIMTWPDGYYAFRYTDLNVLKSDGAKMQNCLEGGTYFREHQMVIYGIRKPNDEPVISLLMINGKLSQCKGKNNNAVTARYVPYVIDFLNRVNWKRIDNSENDLVNAGIYIKDGVACKFEDDAVGYDIDGLKIWVLRLKNDFKLKSGKNVLDVQLRDSKISHIETDGLIGSTNEDRVLLINSLNIINLPPERYIKELLRDYFEVYYGNGRYGLAKDIGEKLFEIADYECYKVESKIFIYYKSKPVGEFIIDDTGEYDEPTIDGIYLERKIATNIMIKILNALGYPPAAYVSQKTLPSTGIGIYFNGKYGKLSDVTELDLKIGDISIFKLGTKSEWVARYADEQITVEQTFFIENRRLFQTRDYRFKGGYDQSTKNYRALMRKINNGFDKAAAQLASKYKVPLARATK